MKFTKKTVNDEIPTASMADITFLLIIFFMVTNTFAATRGLDFALLDHVDAGRPLLGICGGFQMLGRTISDPDGVTT